MTTTKREKAMSPWMQRYLEKKAKPKAISLREALWRTMSPEERQRAQAMQNSLNQSELQNTYNQMQAMSPNRTLGRWNILTGWN